MPHANAADLEALKAAFHGASEPCYKVTNYFEAYVELFAHLRGRDCTFIETGVLNGGSLLMWRAWLGDRARIVGVDLNPSARKWSEQGFEIHIGDQGDPEFLRRVFDETGGFDALLDDGGHQSFQQIVTLREGIAALGRHGRNGVVAVEDTCTSFMPEFASHGRFSFLEYAKTATDTLTARGECYFPDRVTVLNRDAMEEFSRVHAIRFYSGITAFDVRALAMEPPRILQNNASRQNEKDFRHDGGTNSATVEWPDPFSRSVVEVMGASAGAPQRR